MPLISSGGSSVLMTCAALGLLLRVSYELDRAERQVARLRGEALQPPTGTTPPADAAAGRRSRARTGDAPRGIEPPRASASSRHARMRKARMTARTVAPVMILAGGTGGHIFPGLAVARGVAGARRAGDRGSAPTAAWKRGWCRSTASPIDTIAVKGLRGKGIAHAARRAVARARARSAPRARIVAQARSRARWSASAALPPGPAASPRGCAACR